MTVSCFPRAAFASLLPHRRLLAGVFAVTTAALVLLYLWLAHVITRLSVAELKTEVSATASVHASSLSSALNARLALVRGLATFVAVNPLDELGSDFPEYASLLRTSLPGVRNISLSPDFVVDAVHPLEGNERVLGNDLLKDPRPGFADAIRRAIATHDVAVHDPLPLIQGGMGIIARQAVYRPKDRSGTPWGAVGIVFDLQPVLDDARLSRIPATLAYSVRTERNSWVAGETAMPAGDPVVEQIILPEGHWELALEPRVGWTQAARSGGRFLAFQGGFLVLALLVEALVLLTIARRITLEDLIDQRTSQLAQARVDADRRATELDRAKRELEQFAYATAHDLQEPLRAIASYTQLLYQSLADRLGDEEREFIGYVVEGANRLKTLLRDVQLYLADDRVPLPTEPTPAGPALIAAQRSLRRQIDAGGATITADPLPALMADQRRLTEILTILFDNAIEYRHPGRTPEIRVEHRRDGDMDVLSVHDNGIGIEPRYLEQIFEAFRRLHTRKDHPGTGMGLAIARKMAERLGGRIAVDSTPGTGSTFTLFVPAPALESGS